MSATGDEKKTIDVKASLAKINQTKIDKAEANKRANVAATKQAVKQTAEKIQDDSKKREIASQSKKTTERVPTVKRTGAERGGDHKSSRITGKVSDINIERIQKQTKQATENIALAEKTINTIDDTIALLRTGPSLFIVTDPDTGETRRAVGRDIDDLKALKADILKNVASTDVFLQQAPSVIKYYEDKKVYAQTKKSGTKYKVTFLTTTGDKQVETFTSKKEAQEFASALNKVSQDKAKTRATERSFIGLTLSEAADVVRQKRKGDIIKTGTETIKGSEQIEALIGQGRITPGQYVVLGQGGEIELKTVEVSKQPKRYREIITDDVTVLLDLGQKALGTTKINGSTGKRGAPLSESEIKDAVNRGKYLAYATAAGVIIGVGSSLDPRTYIDLGKSGVKAVLNPAKALASTAGVVIALKTAYDTDPIATSGLLIGSVVGSYVTQRVFGPSVKTFYQKAIVPTKTKIFGKISDATKTFYMEFQADTTKDIAQALQYPMFNEIAQAKKFKPISDNILKTISSDPLAAPSFFDKGPQLSLWDQFRQWNKYDFSYIPADPSKATVGVYNKYVEFLNVQAAYLGGRLAKGLNTGTYGEFIQAKKLIVEPKTSTLLDMGLLYFIAQKAGKDPTLITATAGKYTTPLSETFKLKGDFNDYKASDVTDQARAYFELFGPKDSPRLTDEQIRIALKAFKEAINLEKTGPMAIQVEAEAVYRTLIKSGVSKNRATSIASRYAFGLVSISAMKNASPSEMKDYLGALQMVMADLKQENVNISNDMVADLTAQFNRALQTDQIKSFQSLVDKADALNKQFLETGVINDAKYGDLINEIQAVMGVTDVKQAEDVTPILETVPIIEPVPEESTTLKLSLKEQKKRKEMGSSFTRGKVRLYEATYQHKAGRTETIGPIQARSLFDATQKAQRARRSSKQIPRKGSIRLIGETKQ